MSNSIFSDLAFRALSTALDGLSLRQRVTANNVANVDTPGYKAQFVSFEDQLELALHDDTETGLPLQTTARGHLGHSPNSGSSLITVDHNDNVLRNDGNNVDIDLEMTTLAETALLRYQALTQLTGSKLTLLKNIVRGG